jgi:formate dehydrogenase (NADP+) beta subunit
MADNITITIDGIEVKTSKGKKILEAALDAGIYIPNLCSLRGMKLAFGACRLCQVQIEGQGGKHGGMVTACSEPAAEGMIIRSNTTEVNDLRRKVLQVMLARHPHICLGCNRRTHCKPGDVCLRFVGVTEQQCILCGSNGRCELQAAVDFIGLDEMPFPYTDKGLPLETENPYIVRDNNLCILCGRCVRVCEEVLGIGAIAFNKRGVRTVITGSFDRPLIESGCVFCGCCVEVCPTGALSYAGYSGDTGPEREICPVLCEYNCPAGVNVPLFIRFIGSGKPNEALKVIQEKVPLARVCSRICSHPCENACRRNGLDKPISIRALERFAAQQSDNTQLIAPGKITGKKVAIAGSGPTGLTAAYYLAKLGGHEVTVFEIRPLAGGFMRDIKGLPSEVLDADIKGLIELGIKIKVGVPVPTVAGLLEQGYDAVLLTNQQNDAPKRLSPDSPLTDCKGVFAGGELINGSMSFIESVADGRKAAKAVDLYLGGSGDINESLATVEEEIPRVGLRPEFSKMLRNQEPGETGFTSDAAFAESRRCMNCDLRLRVSKLVEQPAVPVKRRPLVK